jgi:hypothetical protein
VATVLPFPKKPKPAGGLTITVVVSRTAPKESA